MISTLILNVILLIQGYRTPILRSTQIFRWRGSPLKMNWVLANLENDEIALWFTNSKKCRWRIEGVEKSHLGKVQGDASSSGG